MFVYNIQKKDLFYWNFMNKDFLEELRKYALYFKLEVGPKYGGAIDVDSLIKVLRSINSSFLKLF